MIRHLIGLFAQPSPGRGASAVILWWEHRRLSYNLILIALCICLIVFFTVEAKFRPYTNPKEVAGTAATWSVILVLTSNVWFVLGWIVELLLRLALRDHLLWLGPAMFGAGLFFSLLFTWFVVMAYTR